MKPINSDQSKKKNRILMSMNLYFGMKLTQDMFDSIFNSDLIYFTKD